MPDTPPWLTQLSTDLANARELKEDTVEVPTSALETALDEYDCAQSSIDHAAGREYELLNEIGQLKRNAGFPVVTLCGSMKFYPRMLEVAAELTAAGRIVLMPHDASLAGIANKTAIEHGAMLDAMHKAKIRMSQSVYIVNTGGYVGESTRSEIAYATELGIPVQYDEEA